MGKVPVLGSTPDGADWCLKALHPSDPQTEVRGIPDKSAIPSVFMNYQSTFVVGNPDPAGVAPWEFLGQLVPHPVNFMTLVTSNGALHVTPRSFLNSQLSGATHFAKYNAFTAMAERWRLAYMSVSVYQDAPALSNQGTLVCAQHAVEPNQFPVFWTSDSRVVTAPTVTTLQATDRPDFNTLQSMPNAYFNRSVEGAYIVLKLTKTCQHWHSTDDQITFTDELYTGLTPTLGERQIPSTTGNTCWPFIGAERRWVEPLSATRGGEVTSNYCNDVWATFAAKNLSPTTSFSFFVRAGFELQVAPGTMLTAHQKLSPKHDRVAIDNYFAISRELKDAYPVEYNDKGVILSTISRVANAVSPYLGMIPGVGGILSPIASGVGVAANALDKLLSPGGQAALNEAGTRMKSAEYGNLTSMADKEAMLTKRLKAETQALAQARRNLILKQVGAVSNRKKKARKSRVRRQKK